MFHADREPSYFQQRVMQGGNLYLKEVIGRKNLADLYRQKAELLSQLKGVEAQIQALIPQIPVNPKTTDLDADAMFKGNSMPKPPKTDPFER